MANKESTHRSHVIPERPQILRILDQLNQARLLQIMCANLPDEKRVADNLFKQCHRWLQRSGVPFYYDEQEHLYLLVIIQAVPEMETKKL
ncbi:hypothetical protein EPA93_29440 [Ktedonosporobacter rubrisoli]|uniref:Uncharacterized protein n=1 Tax=Ktedonosporobacter rubrisoli TaxID=2509675 RepID=A0A4P6JWU9_KTERU|nr:hypothetical protein [Ktedonosporobacter rubrisoli]QBD79882.1 hypothetical protein EPA93_29440 [Ktedonosporobacter rubrisoli]